MSAHHIVKRAEQHRNCALQSMDDGSDSALPPLQSVLELTSAHTPPTQQGEAEASADGATAIRAETAAAHQLEDGTGTLADGSTYEKLSGEEFGDNGYWCRYAWLLLQASPC